jgi:alpha-tubulin suppressor-like RCC1 family protein
VQIGSLTNWSTAQAKGFSTLALKTDGTLWAWGEGTNGQLGDGTITNKSSPVQIGTLTSWTKIGYGSSSAVNGHAIRSGNTLWAWGFGNPNQTDAYGTIVNWPYPTVSQTNYSSPVQVSSSINWSSVATGENHALALTTGGALYAWGTNLNGQCGLSTFNNPEYYVWYQIENQCGGGGSATYGAFYSTYIGAGSYPSLDNGGNCEPPIDGVTATYIEQGANTRLWGFSSPVQVGADTNWAQVSAGRQFSGAIKTTGALWMWGFNGNGQLGNADTTSRSSPVQVGALTTWAYVKCGYDHTLAVKTDGTLWTWGNNNAGALGQNDATARSSPVQIGSATNWLQAIDALDAGNSSSIAIRS